MPAGEVEAASQRQAGATGQRQARTARRLPQLGVPRSSLRSRSKDRADAEIWPEHQTTIRPLIST